MRLRPKQGIGRITLRRVALFVCALVIACQSHATEPLSTTTIFNRNLGPLKVAPGKFISVGLDDNVSDACWTHTEATRTAVQSELKRSGYPIEGSIPAAYVYLSAAGREVSPSLCAVNIMFIVNAVITDSHVVEGHEVRAIENHIMWIRSILIATPKTNISARIKEGFVKMAQMFLTHMNRDRKLLLEEITKNAAETAKAFWSTYAPQ